MCQSHFRDSNLASEDSVLLVPLGANVLAAEAVALLDVAAASFHDVLATTPDFAPDKSIKLFKSTSKKFRLLFRDQDLSHCKTTKM
jgi:hypothetical protein